MNLLPASSSIFCFDRVIRSSQSTERLRWTVFSFLMVGGLFMSIYLAVNQYTRHITTYRVTEDNENLGNRFPDITVCQDQWYVHKEVLDYMFSQAKLHKSSLYMPWLDDAAYKKELRILSNQTSITSRQLNISEDNSVEWISENAPSIYHQLFTRFRVRITGSAKLERVVVLELVPQTANFLCVTLQIWAAGSLHIFDYLQLLIESYKNKNYKVILTEENTHISRYNVAYRFNVEAQDVYTVKYTKTIVKPKIDHSSHFHPDRADKNATSPCREPWETVETFGHLFNYTQGGCVINELFNGIALNCNCSGRHDVLGHLWRKCKFKCLGQQRRTPRDVSERCPPLCTQSIVNIVSSGKEDYDVINLINRCVFRLVIAESTQIRQEIDIYSFSQLWGEIGGLSGLFVGASVMIVFELLEIIIAFDEFLKVSMEKVFSLQRRRRLFSSRVGFIDDTLSDARSPVTTVSRAHLLID